MKSIHKMVKDMELIESVLKNNGKFIGDKVHISISDLADILRENILIAKADIPSDIIAWTSFIKATKPSTFEIELAELLEKHVTEKLLTDKDTQ